MSYAFFKQCTIELCVQKNFLFSMKNEFMNTENLINKVTWENMINRGKSDFDEKALKTCKNG